MAVKSGDFLLVNYTLKVKESGETVDTTFDSVAKDAHIHREDSTFGPKFIILGEGWLPKGLEESLVGLDPGTNKTVELTPEKGYGIRDPGKMRLVPIRRFREKSGVEPNPGLQAELDGHTVAFQEIFKRSEPKPELPAITAKQAEVAPEKEEKAEAEPESAPRKPKSPAKKKETAAKKPSTSTSRKRAKMGSENQR